MPPPVAGSLLDDDMRRRLAAMYAAPDRHYHGLAHIEDLLRLADDHRVLVADLAVMEAAIWFHDAVLDTRRADNEARSAALAREWLAGRASPDRIETVARMIEATATHVVPDDLEGAGREQVALFLDMDLAILAAEPERFDTYEAEVRREYGWVDDGAWRAGRARVLERFVERPAIYATRTFARALEQTARANIRRSLSRLA